MTCSLYLLHEGGILQIQNGTHEMVMANEKRAFWERFTSHNQHIIAVIGSSHHKSYLTGRCSNAHTHTRTFPKKPEIGLQDA